MSYFQFTAQKNVEKYGFLVKNQFFEKLTHGWAKTVLAECEHGLKRQARAKSSSWQDEFIVQSWQENLDKLEHMNVSGRMSLQIFTEMFSFGLEVLLIFSFRNNKIK